MKTENVRVPSGYDEPGIGFSGHGTDTSSRFYAGRMRRSDALLFYNETEGEGLNQEVRTRSTPWSKISNVLGHPGLMGWDMQMHISACRRDIPGSLRNISANTPGLTALGVQVHMYRSLTFSFTLDFPVGLGASGRPCPVSGRCVIAPCVGACLKQQRAARQSRPGIYRLNIRGSVPIPRGPLADRHLPFDRAYQRKPPIRAVLGRDPRRPLHSH